ncbi:hypothetical protein [Thiofilum flexile]|uniref:hypothetical protein n=1 Tax=Thiofilum flexile TaxID=125627 RepID=UPI00035EA968|nr:hypothetical protein [Thiofilum flexile]
MSQPPIQDWYTTLQPRTAAGRRFLEFCKTDRLIQQQNLMFDSKLYLQAVSYALAQIDTVSQSEQDAGI